MWKITTALALFNKIVVIQDLVNNSPLHFEYIETIWKQWIKLHKQEYAYSNAKVNKLTIALIKVPSTEKMFCTRWYELHIYSIQLVIVTEPQDRNHVNGLRQCQ